MERDFGGDPHRTRVDGAGRADQRRLLRHPDAAEPARRHQRARRPSHRHPAVGPIGALDDREGDHARATSASCRTSTGRSCASTCRRSPRSAGGRWSSRSASATEEARVEVRHHRREAADLLQEGAHATATSPRTRSVASSTRLQKRRTTASSSCRCTRRAQGSRSDGGLRRCPRRDRPAARRHHHGRQPALGGGARAAQHRWPRPGRRGDQPDRARRRPTAGSRFSASTSSARRTGGGPMRRWPACWPRRRRGAQNTDELIAEGVRVRVIGRLHEVPDEIRASILAQSSGRGRGAG